MKILKSKALWISIIVICSLIFFLQYGTPWNLYKYNKEFVNYLEDKYHEDFKISEISYDLFHNVYHAKAYQQDDPELKFYVGQNIKDKVITDGYEFEKLNLQADKEITAIVKEELTDYKKAKVNVEVISLDRKEVEVNIWTDSPITTELKEIIVHRIKETKFTTNKIFFNTNS